MMSIFSKLRAFWNAFFGRNNKENLQMELARSRMYAWREAVENATLMKLKQERDEARFLLEAALQREAEREKADSP